jgi:hypothetical protein
MELDILSDDELILLRVDVEQEMRSRKLSYSVGEIGESAAIKYFTETPGLSNLKAAPHGTKNIDAISRNGDRYSIKTIQRAKKTGTVYPDRENPDKQLFEYLLLIRLSPSFDLEAIYRFTWEQFLKVRAWDKRMNAWYLPVSQQRLELGECIYVREPGT